MIKYTKYPFMTCLSLAFSYFQAVMCLRSQTDGMDMPTSCSLVYLVPSAGKVYTFDALNVSLFDDIINDW